MNGVTVVVYRNALSMRALKSSDWPSDNLAKTFASSQPGLFNGCKPKFIMIQAGEWSTRPKFSTKVFSSAAPTPFTLGKSSKLSKRALLPALHSFTVMRRVLQPLLAWPQNLSPAQPVMLQFGSVSLAMEPRQGTASR